jgi:hypothetical protein
MHDLDIAEVYLFQTGDSVAGTLDRSRAGGIRHGADVFRRVIPL